MNAYFNDDKPAEPPPQKVVIQVEQKTPAPVKPSNVDMTPTSPVKSEPQNYFANGEFKVGVDLPAGEYLAVGTGYVEVTKHFEDGSQKIVVNDNLENYRRYFDVQNGEYIKITQKARLYPSAVAPKLDTSGKLPVGHYKIGVDIPAGEYKIILNPGGYCEVTRTTRREGNYIIKNHFTNEGGQFYATVANGQYLQIKNGTGEFVAPAK